MNIYDVGRDMNREEITENQIQWLKRKKVFLNLYRLLNKTLL